MEADVALTDGGTMHVRPVRPDDGPLIERFHQRQSPESIYFRFFSPRPRLSARDLERFTHVDYVDRMAFVGIISDELVGIARYDRHRARSDAEVAFFIDDAHHGRGVATVLLEYLAVAARESGISGFTASVLPQNRKMLGVFTHAGFEAHSRFEEGIIEVELAIDPTPEALAAIEDQARRSEARSVERLLRPHSVAVIGASRSEGTIGFQVFHHLVTAGSRNRVPRQPGGGSRVERAGLGLRARRTRRARPGRDLRARRPGDGRGRAVRGASRAGADRHLVGLRRQGRGRRAPRARPGHAGPPARDAAHRAELPRRHQRVPDVRLHATFADVDPLPGRIGLSAQSGTIGAAIIQRLRTWGLGISSFVAVGNKADVSGNDLLRYWQDDDDTDVVLLYLESFGNPRKFSRIAREVSRASRSWP